MLADLGDFRLDLYQALEPYKAREARGPSRPEFPPGAMDSWHRDSRILPSPPALCAMPQYVGGVPFTGRDRELDDLDSWARLADPVLVVEAIGGTGKSALTWEWATQRAGRMIDGLAGRFWWSFYDGSASTERFLRELIGYLTTASARRVSEIDRGELATLVLNELRRRPFLVVLDGFERMLVAYHRYDPSKVTDDDVDADRRANKHAVIDSLGYDFVRALVTAAPSKFLVSTRMLPDALEGPAGGVLPGVRRWALPGLADEEVLALLHRLGAAGSPAEVAAFFGPLGNHPLLIAIVAGIVRSYRPAPGNFDEWLRWQPFDIRQVNIPARRHHILATALAGLSPEEGKLLGYLSVLSGSAHWRVLEDINPYLVDAKEPRPQANALLDAALRELEVRGLIWWNRTTNTYDMHPVVRAFAHGRLDSKERVDANERIRDYFQALPPERLEAVHSVEDLQQTINLFRAVTGACHYGEAQHVWDRQLVTPLLVDLGANAAVVELLEPYRGTAVTPLVADLSIALHLAGRHDEGIAVELDLLDDLIGTGVVVEIRASLSRLESYYRATGELGKCATVLRFLDAREDNVSGLDVAELTLRRAILSAVCGRTQNERLRALSDLAELETTQAKALHNPWFPANVRYWRLVISHWLGKGPTIAEIRAAEREFPNWRNRLGLAVLRFELLMDHGAHEEALSAATDIDRLRRVGSQEVISAESGLALALLGRPTEAAAAVDECLARMSRVHTFDRPYYLVGLTLAALGRHEDAAVQAHHARARAWADGPEFSHRPDLGRAETFLTELSMPLPKLPTTPAEARMIPYAQALRRVLRSGRFRLGGNRG
jgi:hypothetical protein